MRLDPARFRSVCVGKDVLCPVVAPDGAGAPLFALPVAGGTVPYLAYSAESGLGRIVAGARPAGTRGMLDPVFTSHLAAALRTMALTGRGVAWLPLSLVAEDLAAGRLVRAGTGLDVGMEIRLVRPATRLGAAGERFWGVIAG